MSNDTRKTEIHPAADGDEGLEGLGPAVFARVLDGLPNGIYVVDRDRRILYWNHAAEKITGYLRQEVIGRICGGDLLMHCDRSDVALCGVACPLTETIRDGRDREAKVFLRHRKGWRLPVKVRAIPIRDAGGQIAWAAESFEECRHLLEPVDGLHCVPVPEKIDPVTGVPTRETILAALRSRLSEYGASGIPFGVLGVLVNHAESTRHAYGIREVEAAMEAVAQTLAANLPESGSVGLWSSDRFLVILPGAAALHLDRAIEGVKRLIGMVAIPWWGDRLPVDATVAGTAVLESDTMQEILQRLEALLS
jgi:PAS domain S-box-containing protein